MGRRSAAELECDDLRGEHMEAVGEFLDHAARMADGLPVRTMQQMALDGWASRALDLLTLLALEGGEYAGEARKLLPLGDRFAGVAVGVIGGEPCDDDDAAGLEDDDDTLELHRLDDDGAPAFDVERVAAGSGTHFF